MYEVDRRLWLNQDRTKAVEDGDPEAAFLLATKGKRLTMADAKRLGLIKDEAQVEAVTEEVAEEEQPEAEEKAVESSEAEDKAVRRPSARTKARES